LASNIALIIDLTIEDAAFLDKLFDYIEVIAFTEEAVDFGDVRVLDC
jgi:hypothetical protein